MDLTDTKDRMRTPDEITNLALQEIERGVLPVDFTVGALTDLTDQQIAACVQHGMAQNILRLNWPDNNHYAYGACSQGQTVNVRGPGSRRAVRDFLTEVTDPFGFTLYLTSRHALTDQPLLTATQGMLSVLIPDESWVQNNAPGASEQIKFAGGLYHYSPSVAQYFTDREGWTIFTIDALADKACGAYNAERGEVVIFFNLSQTRNRTGWTVTKRSETSERKVWNEIFTAVLPALDTVTRKDDKLMVTADMLASFKCAQNWQKIQIDRHDPAGLLREDYRTRLTQAHQDREKARQGLQGLQKQLIALKKDLEKSRKSKIVKIQQALSVATVAVKQVRMLPGVKFVKATEIDGFSGLHVQLHDVSIRDEDYGQNYLVQGLEFTAAFTPDGYRIQFHRNGRPLYGQLKCLHPHVFFRHGVEEPCWGEATGMLAAAAKHRSMIMLINVITRWGAHCQQHSHYIQDLRDFPPTDLPVGYCIGEEKT